MPIALIVFCDESHFDLHGTLKVTPLCFTLSCFNESARNRVDFWRPLAFLPTLTHGKLSKDPNTSTVNVQDEHNCISAALSSLVEITKRGGIATTVKGKAVICKVWIYYIISDIFVGTIVWLAISIVTANVNSRIETVTVVMVI